MNHRHLEGRIIQLGITGFWMLFWLFNVIDKFITDPTFLWAGKDRMGQFLEYFGSIGVSNPSIAFWTLIAVTMIELLAFILLLLAFIYFVKSKEKKAHIYFFWGTLTGLVLFSLFTIGDQIFGDRFELLEHTIYWIALIVSWGAYLRFPKEKSYI